MPAQGVRELQPRHVDTPAWRASSPGTHREDRIMDSTRWRTVDTVVAAVIAVAGAAAGFLDVAIYYPNYSLTWRLAQIGLSALSGLVVAGLGSWALTLALARTGVLDRFPSGRERVAV